MLYLSISIALLAISILVAAIMICRTISSSIDEIVVVLKDTPRDHVIVTRMVNDEIIPDGPDSRRLIGASPSLTDVDKERLEIQKLVFDSPPLRAIGGSVSESIGNRDIIEMANGIQRKENMDE